MNIQERYNIFYIKRYEIKCKNQMMLRINDKTYDCSFCHNCGQYLHNYSTRSIICLCDRIPKIFENYRSFIEEIPDDYSGDELEDYIETPESAHKDLMKYIYEMILFGITYEKEYYNKIDNKITNKILEYTI
jgi:hypothetical protein